MKKISGVCALLILTVLLSSCSVLSGVLSGDLPGGDFLGGLTTDGGPDGNKGGVEASPLPEGAFAHAEKQSVIGSIVQTGDGSAHVQGTVPAPRRTGVSPISYRPKALNTENEHLVTLEHAFGATCYVSGYIGNSLYIIQDHGSLAWNKKGIGHKDGTVLLDYGENGYFSISSFSENKVIVGNPTDSSVESLWDPTDSYQFGYMVYDPDTRELTPLYEENNLRFHTAGYFMGGVAMVSVKQGDSILFGIIDEQGNYVVEPQYEMMADESVGDLVIVAKEAEPTETESFTGQDTCGREIMYDSTLMTNVQKTRQYKCLSQSVGLLHVLTGEQILPCRYAYIERVMEDTYFVIDNEGASSFYHTETSEFTPVEQGVYAYFNAEWMLYVDEDRTAYLADQELNLYEPTGLNVEIMANSLYMHAQNRINSNVISAVRDAEADLASTDRRADSGIQETYDPDRRTSTLTVTDTGDVLENVITYVHPYGGGFLYTVDNSLYRYDMESGTSHHIETGYGDYTEDYEGRGVSYDATVGELDDGIYTVRYNTRHGDGASYHMIIVNDRGDVLFASSINSVERLTKNYLGRYDDALYSLAGTTEIEDNYFLTRDDGAHFLIQFVRGDVEGGEAGEESRPSYVRTVDNLSTFSLLSPFKLPFESGSAITVTIDGREIPSDYYVYDSTEPSFKLLSRVFDLDFHMMEALRENGYMEIIVTADGEAVTLRIEVSPFSTLF